MQRISSESSDAPVLRDQADNIFAIGTLPQFENTIGRRALAVSTGRAGLQSSSTNTSYLSPAGPAPGNSAESALPHTALLDAKCEYNFSPDDISNFAFSSLVFRQDALSDHPPVLRSRSRSEFYAYACRATTSHRLSPQITRLLILYEPRLPSFNQ